MHEFELGVWKTLFTHLIRLLHAAGGGSDRQVVELDRRYVLSAGEYKELFILVPYWCPDIVKSLLLAVVLFGNLLQTLQK